jgi:hypothetical protein
MTTTTPMPEIVLQNEEQVSREELIRSNKKIWALRAITIAAMTFFMFYNLTVAWLVFDPLIIYSTLMPIHMLLVFVVGWFFFKNRATGQIPQSGRTD